MSSRVTDSLHYLCRLRSVRKVQENFYDHLVCCWLLVAVCQDYSSPVCLLSPELTQTHIYVTPSFFHGQTHQLSEETGISPRLLSGPAGFKMDERKEARLYI